MSVWAVEMRQKYPGRPLVTWQTIYLRGMVKALKIMRSLNTAEEEARLIEAVRELKMRAKEGRR